MNENKAAILGLGVFWIFTAIGCVVHIRPLTEPESFFPENNELLVYFNDIVTSFHTNPSDAYISVTLIFGTDGISRKGLSRWDQVNLGRVIWDTDFNMAPLENQEYIYDFC